MAINKKYMLKEPTSGLIFLQSYASGEYVCDKNSNAKLCSGSRQESGETEAWNEQVSILWLNHFLKKMKKIKNG